MSGTTLGGDAAFSRFELETLERVKKLAAQHPPVQRPGLRDAVALLRDPQSAFPPEGLPFTLQARTLRLVPRRVFRATGKGTGAVELFVLRDEDKGSVTARMIRKSVRRTALDMSNIRWLTEALFYLDLAPRISCDGIRLPALYGCRADDGAVTLVMEFLKDESADVPKAEWLRASARALGRLGGYTHVHGLYKSPWCERVTYELRPEALLALDHLIHGCLPGAEGENCLSALQDFIDNPQLHHDISAHGIACLVHGDFQPRNLHHLAGGEAGIIDWSHVGQGLIGGDLGRLMLPHYVFSPVWAQQGDFAADVRIAEQEVIEGARELIPDLDAGRISVAIAHALLLAVVRVAAVNPEGMTSRLADGDENFRARLQSIFRYAAENARQIVARFGG